MASRPVSRYAQREFGAGDLPPAEAGGWIAYDDIRQIIKEETKAAVQEISDISQDDNRIRAFAERPRSPSILRQLASPAKSGQAMIAEPAGGGRQYPEAHVGALQSYRERSPTASPMGVSRPGSAAGSHGEIPRKFSDGRTNPYFLLREEMPISLTFFGFLGFSRHSSIRSKCVLMLNDTGWQMFFVLCAVVNSIYISIQPELNLANMDDLTLMMMGWVDFLFLGIFYLEVVAGCVAYGFRGTPKAWFNRYVLYSIQLLFKCSWRKKSCSLPLLNFSSPALPSPLHSNLPQ